MHPAKRLAILATENAECDGLIVDDREALAGRWRTCGDQSDTYGERDGERADHKLHL
jgi:hypothetical protein